MIYAVAAILALLPAASASACAFSADCAGTCLVDLGTCNYQGMLDQYTDSGVPCGEPYGSSLPCSNGAEPLAGNFQDFPLDAMADFQAYLAGKFPIGGDNIAELTSPENLDGAFLVIKPMQTFNVTFIDEGACFRNSMGMITWDSSVVPGKAAADYDDADRTAVLANANLTIFFPNADSITCQQNLDPVLCPDATFCTVTDPAMPLGTTVRMPPYPGADSYVFDVGVYVAFFLVVDGFDAGLGLSGAGYNADAGTLHMSLDSLNDPALTATDTSGVSITRRATYETTVDGVTYDFSPYIFIVFEDNINDDYQDVSLLIDTWVPGTCGGILNDCGDICCPAVCGHCGGCEVDCSELSDTYEVECCPGAIRDSERFCELVDDEGCILIDAEPCEIGNCDLL